MRRRDQYVSLFLAVVLGVTVLLPRYYPNLAARVMQKNNATTPLNVTTSPTITSSLSITPSCDTKGKSWGWQGCPRRNQILVTVLIGGRLGNEMIEYLSAWAVARRFDMWPVMPNETINHLSSFFQDLTVPSIENIAKQCPEFSQLGQLLDPSAGIYTDSHARLLKIVEEQPARNGDKVILLKLHVNLVLTNELLHAWKELPVEMKLKPSFKEGANKILTDITEVMKKASGKKEVELVGIHVRRTDYQAHVPNIYPGAAVADERFFLKAMEWMRKHLEPNPVAFVVVSDDVPWCKQHFTQKDVFLNGTGVIESPGLDLALLSLCNHTIFAYGTFGFVAAMLSQGRFTVVFDTQNKTHTAEMKYAPHLPGWHMLDHEGRDLDHPNPF